MRLSTTLLFGSLALAPVASAQYGTLLDRGIGFGAVLSFPEDALGVGANVGWAAPMYDLTLGYTRTTPEDNDLDIAANTFSLGGTAYLSRQSMTMPVTFGLGADLAYQTLESDALDAANASVSAVGVTPYLSLSHRATLSPSLMLVPEARVGAAFYSTTTEVAGSSSSESDTEFAAQLGVSFVFGTGSTRFALTPAVDYVAEEWTPAVRLSVLLPR